MNTRYSLLDEKLITVRHRTRTTSLSLPGVLAALARDEVDDFPALRPHQHHAWHAFLVQAAAMALDPADRFTPPDTAEAWRGLLVRLAGGAEEAWALLVTAWDRPAFMQPPVTSTSLTSADGQLEAILPNEVTTPDELDLLITSKNHDLKGAVMADPTPEQWALALVSLQTTEGFGGAGNYGVVRMNGGYGSRVCVTFVPDARWGARFKRDVAVALEVRDEIVDAHGYPASGGHRLLWLLPWDGATPLGLTSLDPFFIEICRRVRLVSGARGLHARRTTTKAARVLPGETEGRVGDLWTPIEGSAGKSFSVSEAGFGFRKSHDLLFGGGWVLPPTARQLRGGGGGELLLQGLARGQGHTSGYHERSIRVPARAALWLAEPTHHDRLAELSKERIEQAATVTHRVLKPAILTFMNGAVRKSGPRRDDRPRRWLDAFDAAIDVLFFPGLFADAGRDPEEAGREFAETLRALALEQLEDAFRGAPTRAARRWQAVALAESVFQGAFRKQLAAYLNLDPPGAGGPEQE